MWIVLCLDEDGHTSMATRRIFDVRADALRYAEEVSLARDPRVAFIAHRFTATGWQHLPQNM